MPFSAFQPFLFPDRFLLQPVLFHLLLPAFFPPVFRFHLLFRAPASGMYHRSQHRFPRKAILPESQHRLFQPVQLPAVPFRFHLPFQHAIRYISGRAVHLLPALFMPHRLMASARSEQADSRQHQQTFFHPLPDVKARAGLDIFLRFNLSIPVSVGRCIPMPHHLPDAILPLQFLYQLSQRLLLFRRACVCRFSVGIQPAYIADADTGSIPAFAVCSGLLYRPPFLQRSVQPYYIMISDVPESPLPVPSCDVDRSEVRPLSGCGAVNNDAIHSSHDCSVLKVRSVALPGNPTCCSSSSRPPARPPPAY